MGLSKAERHAIKRHTRHAPRIAVLQLFGEHAAVGRLMMAELHKRGFRYDDFRQCWTQRARLR